MSTINLNKINLNGSSGGGGVPEAPVDDKTYGRKNATWVEIGGQPEPTVNTPLKFTANGAATLSIYNQNFTPIFYKSSDGITWEDWDYSDISLADGESVYIKGDNPDGLFYEDENENEHYCSFIINDGIYCEGNIMSLLGETITDVPEYAFARLFSECAGLLSAPVLPATTLAKFCYGYMFYGCSLISEVTIKATDISASDCLDDWLSGVAASGTIYCEPSMVSTFEADEDTPSGWTVKPILTLENLDGKVTDLERNVGDLDDLETTAKTNLVGAVNEVKGEADDKADKVAVASSIPAGGLLPNTFYNLGTISSTTTISLATATDLTHLNEYMFRFSVGSSVPTITLPTGVVYGKSKESVPPTLEANTGYEFSIVDGWALYESFDLS